jgi:hypothetical protein
METKPSPISRIKVIEILEIGLGTAPDAQYISSFPVTVKWCDPDVDGYVAQISEDNDRLLKEEKIIIDSTLKSAITPGIYRNINGTYFREEENQRAA